MPPELVKAEKMEVICYESNHKGQGAAGLSCYLKTFFLAMAHLHCVCHLQILRAATLCGPDLAKRNARLPNRKVKSFFQLQIKRTVIGQTWVM